MCTRKQQGFTLTELLIVMVIAAIMAMIALPNMSQWIASPHCQSRGADCQPFAFLQGRSRPAQSPCLYLSCSS